MTNICSGVVCMYVAFGVMDDHSPSVVMVLSLIKYVNELFFIFVCELRFV